MPRRLSPATPMRDSDKIPERKRIAKPPRSPYPRSVFSIILPAVSSQPMPKFRKSIAAVIVLCLVGLSTAWALDSHAVDAWQPERLIDVSDSAPLPDKHNHTDDHCCHGGSHLVGIDQSLRPTLPDTHSAPQTPSSCSLFVSRTSPPPLRPPQS